MRSKREMARLNTEDENPSIFLDLLHLISAAYCRAVLVLGAYAIGSHHAMSDLKTSREQSTVYLERALSQCRRVPPTQEVGLKDLDNYDGVPVNSVPVLFRDRSGALTTCFLQENSIGCTGDACDPSLINTIKNSQETCDNDDPQCRDEVQKVGS